MLQPYQMVKDLRTDYEMGNTGAVLDGDIDPFIEAWLKDRGRRERRRHVKLSETRLCGKSRVSYPTRITELDEEEYLFDH